MIEKIQVITEALHYSMWWVSYLINASMMPIPRHTHAQVVNEINSWHLHTLKIDLIGVPEKKWQKIINEKVMATTKNEALKSSLNSHEAGQDNLNG